MTINTFRLPPRSGLSCFAATLFFLIISNSAAISSDRINPEVENALLAEKWEKVAELLDSVGPETTDPVLRLIKGHACLALNRNNEQICLFSASNDSNSLQTWLNWTTGLEESKNKTSAYLKGDALARLKRSKEAMKYFAYALSIDSCHFLSLHARGVVLASQRDFIQANRDLRNAIKIKESNADLWASRGSCLIQSRGDQNKALEAYSISLKNSPEYILAINGRGCIRMSNEVLYDSAYSDFKSIGDKLNECNNAILARLAINGAKLTHYISVMRDTLLLQLTGIEPGTPIQTRLEALNKLTPSMQQQAIDAIHNDNGYRNRIIQNPFHPTGGDLTGKITTKKTPFSSSTSFEGSGSLNYDFKGADQAKLDANKNFLNEATKKFGMAPKPMSDIEAFRLQKFGGFGSGGNDWRTATNPGGIKSSEMAQDSLSMVRKWDVTVLYGLLYPEP